MHRRTLMAGLAASVWVSHAAAQPSQKPLVSLADTGVSTHRFHRFAYVSADGKRRYRIMVALPKQAAVKTGYASLWLCDGNAALMALEAETLEAHPDLAIVALGYETDQRFDLVARNFDYTPAVNGPETVDELRAGQTPLWP